MDESQYKREKILIVDDHPLFSEGLEKIIHIMEPDTCILHAFSFQHGIQICASHPDLDLILLDLNLPDRNDVCMITAFRKKCPEIKIAIISACENQETVSKYLKEGVNGYIPKSSKSNTLIMALKLVLGGDVYVPPTAFNTELTSSRNKKQKLTNRQMEVLRLLGKGMSNKEICRQLSLAEGTVRAHLSTIFSQLGVSSRLQAVNKAKESGVIA
ncbi:MAG: response regulator transcription factor [Gammaproteobacteria bacterium]|nr:response regulator transcription factor [Gammaproteobacteria bacterium]